MADYPWIVAIPSTQSTAKISQVTSPQSTSRNGPSLVRAERSNAVGELGYANTKNTSVLERAFDNLDERSRLRENDRSFVDVRTFEG